MPSPAPSIEDNRNPFCEAGAAIYDRDAARMPIRYRFARKIQNQLIVSSLFQHETPGVQLVVDFGSGTANDGLEILTASPCAYYTGIDSSPAMISIATEKMRNAGFSDRSAFLECNLFTTSVQDMVRLLQNEHISDEVTIVMSSLALHHNELEEKGKVYALAYELLRSGGLFVLSDLFSNDIHCCAQHAIQTELNDLRDAVLVSDKTPAIPKIPTTLSVTHYKNSNRPQQLSREIALLEVCGFVRVDVAYRHGQLGVMVAEKE